MLSENILGAVGSTVNRVAEAVNIIRGKDLLIDRQPELLEKLNLIQLAVGEGDNPFSKHKELIERLYEISGDRYYSKSFISDESKKVKLIEQFEDNHLFKQLGAYVDKNWEEILDGIKEPTSKNFLPKKKALQILADLHDDMYDNRQEYVKRLGIGEHFKSVTKFY